MPLRLNGSTSGYSQLDAPAIAGDQTFTLPGTGGTLDRLNRVGNILQVVPGNTSTKVTVATATYTDTGLSASITPTASTNKILVIVNQETVATRTANAASYGIRLLRESTVIYTPLEDATGPFDFGTSAGGASSMTTYARAFLTYLDSPNSTSSITYKTQGRPYQTANSGTVIFQNDGATQNGISYIYLIEVAAS